MSDWVVHLFTHGFAIVIEYSIQDIIRAKMAMCHCVHCFSDLFATHLTVTIVKMVETFNKETTIYKYGNSSRG